MHYGELYDTLASCAANALATLPARQTAEENSPHANPAVRTRVFVLYQVLLPAYLFEKGVKGALAARVLEQKVKGALRVAVAEVSPGLEVAARGEKVDLRRAVLGEVGKRVQRELAVQLRAIS